MNDFEILVLTLMKEQGCFPTHLTKSAVYYITDCNGKNRNGIFYNFLSSEIYPMIGNIHYSSGTSVFLLKPKKIITLDQLKQNKGHAPIVIIKNQIEQIFLYLVEQENSFFIYDTSQLTKEKTYIFKNEIDNDYFHIELQENHPKTPLVIKFIIKNQQGELKMLPIILALNSEIP